MSLEQLEESLPHPVVRCGSSIMEFGAHFEKVRYCLSVPTIAECAVGRLHFLDSIEVGIDGVSSRHHCNPTFHCGIVTLRYGLPYNTRVRTK